MSTLVVDVSIFVLNTSRKSKCCWPVASVDTEIGPSRVYRRATVGRPLYGTSRHTSDARGGSIGHPYLRVPDPKHLATIRIMAEKALKLRYHIGEAMISSDYEVVIPEPGSPYASGYGGGIRAKGQRAAPGASRAVLHGTRATKSGDDQRQASSNNPCQARSVLADLVGGSGFD